MAPYGENSRAATAGLSATPREDAGMSESTAVWLYSAAKAETELTGVGSQFRQYNHTTHRVRTATAKSKSRKPASSQDLACKP